MKVCCEWQNHGQRPAATGADPQLVDESLCNPQQGSAEQRGKISRRTGQVFFSAYAVIQYVCSLVTGPSPAYYNIRPGALAYFQISHGSGLPDMGDI